MINVTHGRLLGVVGWRYRVNHGRYVRQDHVLGVRGGHGRRVVLNRVSVVMVTIHLIMVVAELFFVVASTRSVFPFVSSQGVARVSALQVPLSFLFGDVLVQRHGQEHGCNLECVGVARGEELRRGSGDGGGVEKERSYGGEESRRKGSRKGAKGRS